MGGGVCKAVFDACSLIYRLVFSRNQVTFLYPTVAVIMRRSSSFLRFLVVSNSFLAITIEL